MKVSATIPIKALTWKRTRGSGNRRYMPESEREYYLALNHAFFRDFLPFPPAPVELRILRLEFHFVDKGWRDIDNLLKGFLDSGQPSKWWLPKNQRQFVKDHWDDKQFSEILNLKRVRGSDGYYIVVEIEEVEE